MCQVIGSAVIGRDNVTHKSYSMAIGECNNVVSKQSIAIGKNNTINNNTIHGGYNYTIGKDNTNSGYTDSYSFGVSNTNQGSDSYAFGRNNTLGSKCSVAVGRYNSTSHIKSYLFGENLHSYDNCQVVIGKNSTTPQITTSNSSVIIASGTGQYGGADMNAIEIYGYNTGTLNIKNLSDTTTIAGALTVGQNTSISTTVGRIDAKNDIVAYSTSDRRLKENIQPIENALCKVIGVSGNTFDWKKLSEEEVKTIHGNQGRDVGVIAQEIESILPEAVTTRDSGYKAVNYEKIVPLLIEAIKEQQKQIDELKSKL